MPIDNVNMMTPFNRVDILERVGAQQRWTALSRLKKFTDNREHD